MVLAFVPLCARSRVSGHYEVGHEGVITGRDAFSLRSSIANPQGVAQPPLQSTYMHGVGFNKMLPLIPDDGQKFIRNHLYGILPKHGVVDICSDWVLSWGRQGNKMFSVHIAVT